MIRILGVDPGTATVGWAIIDQGKGKLIPVGYGCINTSIKQTTSQRLKEIAKDLEEIIKKFHPQEAAVEDIFFFKNLKTAVKVSQARGVILLTSENLGLKIFEYTPLQLKQAITGYGRAEKKQIQIMVKNILKLKAVPSPDDVADALAIAICHGNSRKISALH
jgi:crossover junction endodeoxyribonuclease RuvC